MTYSFSRALLSPTEWAHVASIEMIEVNIAFLAIRFKAKMMADLLFR